MKCAKVDKGVSCCAGIERDQVNYINAHATSTLVGDIAEVKAVRSVFSDWSSIKMNGTKSMVGHCLGAAAGVEAIATIQAIRKGEVHPTINHKVRGLVRTCMPQQAGRHMLSVAAGHIVNTLAWCFGMCVTRGVTVGVLP